MRLSHDWGRGAAVFDDENLVSCAGLVPVMELAEQTGLSDLLDAHVVFGCERIRSGAANPTPKLTSVIAGLLAGADSIDDLDLIRAGGMKRLFGGVYAPATLGILLREFTGGHVRQLHAVLRRHLLALTLRTPVLDGITTTRALVDIDSLLRPVYGHAKQGASFGHTKIANRQVLRKGLSPLATTISTATAAPVLAGIRLRAGKAGSGKGAASMVTEAVNTAKAAGARDILVRGDSAYGNGKVIAAVLKTGARFSFTLAKQPSVNRAIGLIDQDAWTPVHYPGEETDPDTGELISDAEVAEIDYTAFAGSAEEITARLIVRRVRDRNHPDELFPVWRYHPFFTNNTEPVTDADITHRQHAIIESVFADLIDGPLAHMPSGFFPANSAWTVLTAITHNLLRAAGTLSGKAHAVARGATLRRHLINVPARLARPQGKRTLHLPAHWPRAGHWNMLWGNVFADPHRQVIA
ncbi:MAG TPA: IS1380 family transposase [Nakamurella sp.]|nr:IS1380 family transposase [Nakamurella sp.]